MLDVRMGQKHGRRPLAAKGALVLSSSSVMPSADRPCHQTLQLVQAVSLARMDDARDNVLAWYDLAVVVGSPLRHLLHPSSASTKGWRDLGR
jgi:hypothetical protein